MKTLPKEQQDSEIFGPWPHGEIELLKRWKADGRTYEQISARLGRSEASVGAMCRSLGLTRRVQNSWTREREIILERLWKEGLSASQIARKMGQGISRNAVIGKVTRMGLASTARPAKVYKRRKHLTITRTPAKRVAAKKPKPKPLPPQPKPVTGGIPFEDLTNTTCKWPITDSLPHRFCGCKCAPDKPYCDEHAKHAYSGKVHEADKFYRPAFVFKDRKPLRRAA